MKKIWLLLIIGLLLSACASSQTEAPPTLTPLPPTLVPNPYGEDALITFCESIVEGDVDRALSLFTEETRIYIVERSYFDLRGVKKMVKEWSNFLEYSCEVKDFEVNGDVVEFSWNEKNTILDDELEGLFEAKCKCTATMIEEKIDKLDCKCSEEITWLE